MFDSKPIDTPMGTNSKLIEDASDSLVKQPRIGESLDPCCILLLASLILYIVLECMLDSKHVLVIHI